MRLLLKLKSGWWTIAGGEADSKGETPIVDFIVTEVPSTNIIVSIYTDA